MTATVTPIRSLTSPVTLCYEDIRFIQDRLYRLETVFRTMEAYLLEQGHASIEVEDFVRMMIECGDRASLDALKRLEETGNTADQIKDRIDQEKRQ